MQKWDFRCSVICGLLYCSCSNSCTCDKKLTSSSSSPGFREFSWQLTRLGASDSLFPPKDNCWMHLCDRTLFCRSVWSKYSSTHMPQLLTFQHNFFSAPWLGNISGKIWSCSELQHKRLGVTKRCRQFRLTNSALVYEPKCGRRGELRALSQWVQLSTGAQINFADLTPYLTYDIYQPPTTTEALYTLYFGKNWFF